MTNATQTDANENDLHTLCAAASTAVRADLYAALEVVVTDGSGTQRGLVLAKDICAAARCAARFGDTTVLVTFTSAYGTRYQQSFWLSQLSLPTGPE